MPGALIRVRPVNKRLSIAAPERRRAGPAETETLLRAIKGLRLSPDFIVDANWVDNGSGWLAIRLVAKQGIVCLPRGSNNVIHLLTRRLTNVSRSLTLRLCLIGTKGTMLKSFKNRSLKDLFETGKTAKINAAFHKRIIVRLDALDQAETISDLSLPGFKFHALHGFDPTRYTIHVNGPWCMTFEFNDGDAFQVDFEQYH